MVRSHGVTGGGRGIGRTVAERLLADGDAVVVLDRDVVSGARPRPQAGNPVLDKLDY